MPLAKGARTRARRAEAVLKKVVSLALEIEEPLNDVSDFVGALRLIGNGMRDEGDGRAVAATAYAASARVDALRSAWLEMFRAARSGKLAVKSGTGMARTSCRQISAVQ